jgi:hypothetical protein
MIRFARHRPSWLYRELTSRNQISDFPLVPETPTYVRPPEPPSPIPVATAAWPPAPAAAEIPSQPEQRVQVALVQKLDPAPTAAPQTNTSDAASPQPMPQEAHQPNVTAEPAPPPTAEPAAEPAAPKPKPRKKYKKRPRRKPRTVPEAPAPLAHPEPASSLSHHERHCIVCSHPERAGLEQEFLHWHYVNNIAHDYGVHPRSVYRHAHALGLFDERDRNLRFSLGHIIHRAQIVRATADTVIRAVHAFTRVNHAGQWVEPPTRVIFSTEQSAPSPASPPPGVIDVTPPAAKEALPDTVSRVEHDPTR